MVAQLKDLIKNSSFNFLHFYALKINNMIITKVIILNTILVFNRSLQICSVKSHQKVTMLEANIQILHCYKYHLMTFSYFATRREKKLSLELLPAQYKSCDKVNRRRKWRENNLNDQLPSLVLCIVLCMLILIIIN